MMSKRGSQPGSPATYTSPNRIRSPDASVDYSADLGVGPKDVLSGEQKAVVVLVNKIVSKVCELYGWADDSFHVILGPDWEWSRWTLEFRLALPRYYG